MRTLGRGRVQQQAIGEVLDLARDEPLRIMVLRLLANWKIRLEQTEQAEGKEMAVQRSLSSLGAGNFGAWRAHWRGARQLEAVPALQGRGFTVLEIAEILGLSVEQVQAVL